MLHYILKDGLLIKNERIVLYPRDQGLLYGFSLFETMRVKDGRIIMLRQHLERLTASAAALGVPVGANMGLMAAGCIDAVEDAGTVNGALRFTVTAGPVKSGPGVILISVTDGTPYPPGCYEKGFSLLTLSFPRNEKSPLVSHKTANYLENLLGRREAVRMGFDEGIFLNSVGNVAEGTTSNIFLVREGRMLTPPPETGLLPGTVRQQVIELAPVLGYQCREAHITIDDINAADECFLTNSLMGVMPATCLDGNDIGNGLPGRVTLELMQLYEKTWV